MITRARSKLTYANVGTTLALVLAVSGFAVAAVPGADGTITGCYHKKTGKLRVIDAAKKCHKRERPLTWSQTGPTGPSGEPGAPGSAIAYAHVRPDGTVNESLSKNIVGVTKPFPANPGFYCIDVGVGVKSVAGQVELGADPSLTLQATVDPQRPEFTDPGTCPPPNDAAVRLRTTGGTSTAEDYYIVFN